MNSEIGLHEALELIALDNRLNPDFYANCRAMCRLFSKKFHMPLPEVEKLSIEYIMLHLFEDNFTNLDSDKLKETKHNLLNRINRKLVQEDAEWIEEQEYLALKAEQEMLVKNNKQSLPPPGIELTF